MSISRKRGINKSFLKQLYEKFGFSEFRVTDAGNLYSLTRNKPEFALFDAHSELQRFWQDNVVIHEKGKKYRLNPESSVIMRLISKTL